MIVLFPFGGICARPLEGKGMYQKKQVLEIGWWWVVRRSFPWTMSPWMIVRSCSNALLGIVLCLAEFVGELPGGENDLFEETEERTIQNNSSYFFKKRQCFFFNVTDFFMWLPVAEELNFLMPSWNDNLWQVLLAHEGRKGEARDRVVLLAEFLGVHCCLDKKVTSYWKDPCICWRDV